MSLPDAKTYNVLKRIDEDTAAQVREQGCSCGGALHSAKYPRKPRGGPAGLGEGFDNRLSFCCAVEGCRHRATPPSVIFLGRKVYLGAVVVLVTSLRHGTTPWRLKKLREVFGVSVRTIERWRSFWTEAFVKTPFWRRARGRFASPVDTSALPASLLERFGGDLVSLLVFLSPITTSSCPGTSMAF
jgi:hypothetical protein